MEVVNIRKGNKHSSFSFKAQVITLKYYLLQSVSVTAVLGRINSTQDCTKYWLKIVPVFRFT